MNIYILKTIRSRATKFDNNMSFYWTQLYVFSEFGLAKKSLYKSKKFIFDNSWMPEESVLLYTIILTARMIQKKLIAII